jgi:hypothetical protein
VKQKNHRDYAARLSARERISKILPYTVYRHKQ